MMCVLPPISLTSGWVLLMASTMACRPADRSSISSKALPPDAETAMITWCGVLRTACHCTGVSLSLVSMGNPPSQTFCVDAPPAAMALLRQVELDHTPPRGEVKRWTC